MGATTPAGTPGAENNGPREFDSRTLWLFGLVPIFMACIHVLVVSRGNAETARALVENFDVSSLVVASVLPLLTSAMLWLSFAYVTNKRVQQSTRNAAGLALFTTVVVSYFAMPLLYVCINGGVILVGALAARKVPVIAQVVAILIILGPIPVWVAFLGVFMPKERITIGNQETSPVYVLSSDLRWTKYMTDADRRVHIAPTQAVTHRQMVGESTSIWRKSIHAAIWGGEPIEVPDPAVAPTPATVTVTVPR